MTVFYVILAILLFGVLIFVHELGHFVTAKLSGVQVNEFALFMGPALWKKKKGETTYSLRCSPIGGYCAMEGEDEDSDNPRAFGRAKAWKRLIILAAGSFMNFVCGFLILLIVLSVTNGSFYTREFAGAPDDRPFASYLQPGDEFYAINGERVYIGADIEMLLDRDTDGYQDITVRRGGELLALKNVPIARDYIAADGTARYGFSIGVEEKSFSSVLSNTWRNCKDFARLVRLGLQDLFTGRANVKEMSGAVGIVAEVAKQGTQAESIGLGLANVFYLVSFIAVNRAVMNMLPIPALDGGRIVCLLVTTAAEKLFRRKITPKYEAYLNGAFMVLLLIFMALITFKDVFQIFGG